MLLLVQCQKNFIAANEWKVYGKRKKEKEIEKDFKRHVD